MWVSQASPAGCLRRARPSHRKAKSSCNFLQSCRARRCAAVCKVEPGLEFRHAATEGKEHRQMWLYVQMWLPLISITLAAAICVGLVYFIKRPAKPQP